MIGLRSAMAAGILILPGVVAAQRSGADSLLPTRAGVYTDEQAVRGHEVYQMNCVNCHTPASHAGPEFVARWEGRLLWDLFHFVRESMPKSEPGSLSEREYVRVLAYLLKLNGMPAGASELPADSTALKKIRIDFVLARDSTQQR